MAFRLAYLHFTLAHSKSQGQDHPHIDCDYLANSKQLILLLPSNMKSHISFLLAYLDLTNACSKGQGHAHFDCEYL